MRILIVAYGPYLESILKIMNIGNDELEICSIVTVPFANIDNMFDRYGVSIRLMHPYYDLPECVNNFYYDFVFYASEGNGEEIGRQLRDLGVEKEKLVNLSILASPRLYNISRLMRYYEAHVKDFSVLLTGSSYAHYSVNGKNMSLPLLDFSVDSQDIYYGYMLAEHVLSQPGASFRAVLINLAPWSFSYDLSKSTSENFLCIAYALLLGKSHHFPLDMDGMRLAFRNEFLQSAFEIAFDGIDIFDLNGNKHRMSHDVGVAEFLRMRLRAESWGNKRVYPETQKENVQLLVNYINLCYEHGAIPVLFLAPVMDIYRRFYPKRNLDHFYWVIRDVIKKTGAPLLDYFWMNGFGVQECRDVDHLNEKGSKIFSPKLERDLIGLLEDKA